jgi:hypothetical protein
MVGVDIAFSSHYNRSRVYSARRAGTRARKSADAGDAERSTTYQEQPRALLHTPRNWSADRLGDQPPPGTI